MWFLCRNYINNRIFAKLQLKLKLTSVKLVLLEQSESVSIYSVHKDGEEHTEFERFLLAHCESHPNDVARIMYRLDRIKEDGCFERHFRYAGKYRDRTFELPSKFDTIELRVFCIVVSEHILILGNGGLKTSATYNEDPWLNSCETEMQHVDAILKRFQRIGKIAVCGKIIKGNIG